MKIHGKIFKDIGIMINEVQGMVTVESFSEMIGKEVFTDRGIYCGRVADLDLDIERFRVRGILVDAVKGSYLAGIVGAKKGVIIPFHLVQSIGDVVIIKSISPSLSEVSQSEE